MCEVLDRVEQKGERRGITIGERRGALIKARETALNLRKMGFGPVQVAQIVNVEAELVERWFEEEQV